MPPYSNPYSQVFQGQPGTGAAFIINGNRAADIFHQNIAQEEQQRRLEELQRQKALQDQQTLINKNLSKANLADHWNAHDTELQTGYKNLMDQATELKMKGIDASTDPEWKSKLSSLNNQAQYSGKLFTGLNEFQKEIDTNPDKYSQESIEARKAYYDPKKPLAQYVKEGSLPPALQPKYTLNSMIKGLKGTGTEEVVGGQIIKRADRAKNLDQVLSLQDTPAFKNFVKEAGANPEIGAFPVDKSGKTVYSTSDEDLLPIIDGFLSTATVPDFKKLGLLSQTPEDAKVELLDIMKRQNHAYQQVIDAGADALDAQVDGSNRKDYQADANARGWANLKLSQRRENRLSDKDAEGKQSATYRQSLINDMFDGVAGSGEKLVAAMKGNSDYVGELKIQRLPGDASKLVLKVPGKVIVTDIDGVATKKTIPGKTITLDKNNPDDKITLNQIISDATKEPVSMSQLLTPGGKKIVKGSNGAVNILKPSKDPLNLF